jgi:ubiquitin carboxyl-terminal hydrolase 4/11/15
MPATLVNIGNTCGINSLLQCISNILLEKNFKFLNEKEFSSSLYRIINMMVENPTRTIKPKEFINKLFINSEKIFKEGQQLDVCELWTFICNKIHEEISILKKENEIYIKANYEINIHNDNKISDWINIFQGSTISTTKCENCKNITSNFEPFYNLSLNIKKESIIESLIELVSEKEYEDEWVCSNCKKQRKYIKCIKIWKLPEILVITLNRFDNNLKKINSKILINNTINLKQGVLANEMDRKRIYKLNSCIHHKGDYNSGHYITSIINEKDITIIDDDSSYNKSNGEFQNSDNVYVLFYNLI